MLYTFLLLTFGLSLSYSYIVYYPSPHGIHNTNWLKNSNNIKRRDIWSALYGNSDIYNDGGFPREWSLRTKRDLSDQADESVKRSRRSSFYGPPGDSDGGFPTGWKRSQWYGPSDLYTDSGFPGGWNKRSPWYGPPGEYGDGGFPTGWNKRSQYYGLPGSYTDGGFPKGWKRNTNEDEKITVEQETRKKKNVKLEDAKA